LEKRPLFLSPLSSTFLPPPSSSARFYLGVRGLFRGLAGDVALEGPLGAASSSFFSVFIIIFVVDAEGIGDASRGDSPLFLVLLAVVSSTSSSSSFRRQAQAILDPLLADEHREKKYG
jgi:hypothetical protein